MHYFEFKGNNFFEGDNVNFKIKAGCGILVVNGVNIVAIDISEKCMLIRENYETLPYRIDIDDIVSIYKV